MVFKGVTAFTGRRNHSQRLLPPCPNELLPTVARDSGELLLTDVSPLSTRPAHVYRMAQVVRSIHLPPGAATENVIPEAGAMPPQRRRNLPSIDERRRRTPVRSMKS